MTCLLLACHEDIDRVRQKRRQVMDAQYEQLLQRESDKQMRVLINKMKVEQHPDNWENLEKAKEVRKKTQEMLMAMRKDTAMDILPYRKWFHNELVLFSGKDYHSTQPFLATANKRADILRLEQNLLARLSGGEWGVTGYVTGTYLIAKKEHAQVFDNKNQTGIMCLDLQRYGYELDSLWVNDVWQNMTRRDARDTLKIPALKAGKQTLRLKCKYYHRIFSQKDTTIYATHTFEVLPKK